MSQRPSLNLFHQLLIQQHLVGKPDKFLTIPLVSESALLLKLKVCIVFLFSFYSLLNYWVVAWLLMVVLVNQLLIANQILGPFILSFTVIIHLISILIYFFIIVLVVVGELMLFLMQRVYT